MTLLNEPDAVRVAKTNSKKINTHRFSSSGALRHLNIYMNHLQAIGKALVKDYSEVLHRGP